MINLALVIGLLAVTVVCVALGERLRLPYPILMLLASSGIASIPGLQHLEIDQELILPLFLPPLLFATAQKTDWSVFRYRWRTLLFLAVGLTATTALLVAGAVSMLVTAVSFPLALMVGAMVAPPDPIAVEAVAGPARMPRRLLSMLQTEGLFNDAVAIVLFTAALNTLTGDSSLGLGLALDFVVGAVIAVGIGLALGFLYRFASHRVTTTAARTAMSVVVPFAAYMLAEELHASGVIAVVVTALETRRRARAEDSEARISRATFWDVANLLVTGLAFGLMGMQLRDVVANEGADVLRYLPVAAVACVVVIVMRLIGMFAIAPIARIDAGENLTWKDSVVLTWCGMRGLATLALALAIPTSGVSGAEADARNMMVIVACAVLLVTLVPTGLGLGWLLRLLKLQDDGSVAEQEIAELTHRAQRAALGAIRERFEDTGELTEEQMRAVKKRFKGLRQELDSTTQAMSVVGPDGTVDPEAQKQLQARRRKMKRGRELMVTAQTVGLDAARTEVLQARSEPGIDPEAADRVLRQLDLQMLAAPPRNRARKH
ncbi:Na+/H+ antiporter [Brachybacterium endophyticum]|uniref:Na+/H+ antiporter n=1 Tax=Brachybacterium endophyticum TaxID=2182385 RepID=A0A2U2RJP9_9MICO|nr:sodium:proton antiporter [Brachybacterium endophyticum]PWH06093.1 Na+/H+ antiporter [Brachybacterium endophyticum]